jgi:hypothetical protein
MDEQLRDLHRQWLSSKDPEIAQRLAHLAIIAREYRFLPVRDPGDMGWLDGALEMRNTYHFSRLVPNSGSSGTIEGELLRAINRMVYRYYNDGDEIGSDSGPSSAHAFLTEGDHPLRQQMQDIFNQVSGPRVPLSTTRALHQEKIYVRQFVTALELILDYIEQNPTLTTSSVDYLEAEPVLFECDECHASYGDEESADECCTYNCWTCDSRYDTYEEAEECCTYECDDCNSTYDSYYEAEECCSDDDDE